MYTNEKNTHQHTNMFAYQVSVQVNPKAVQVLPGLHPVFSAV